MLEEAGSIRDCYNTRPGMQELIKVLRVFSNQKTNQYLRKIAEKVKARKEPRFHTAWHRCATLVTLANGAPIETVIKLGGDHRISTILRLNQVY